MTFPQALRVVLGSLIAVAAAYALLRFGLVPLATEKISLEIKYDMSKTIEALLVGSSAMVAAIAFAIRGTARRDSRPE